MSCEANASWTYMLKNEWSETEVPRLRYATCTFTNRKWEAVIMIISNENEKLKSENNLHKCSGTLSRLKLVDLLGFCTAERENPDMQLFMSVKINMHLFLRIISYYICKYFLSQITSYLFTLNRRFWSEATKGIYKSFVWYSIRWIRRRDGLILLASLGRSKQ